MSRLAAPLVLCVSGLLILTACSLERSVTPGGNVTRSGTSASPVPVANSSTESVRLGPFTQVFSTPLPASPAQAKVVAGFRVAQILWEKSNIAGHLVKPVKAYVIGEALYHLVTAMTVNKSHDLVPAGTDRMFKTRVTSLTGNTATVTTCDDGSKYREQNPRTGKVNAAYTPSLHQAYLFETWYMVYISGNWAISSFSVATYPDPSAQHCQP